MIALSELCTLFSAWLVILSNKYERTHVTLQFQLHCVLIALVFI